MKAVIQASNLEAIAWPDKCVRCGHGLSQDRVGWWQIKIKRSLKSFVTCSIPKMLTAKLCDSCLSRVSRRVALCEKAEKAGLTCIGIAFIGPFIVAYDAGDITNVGPIIHSDAFPLIGGLFWCGVILLWVGDFYKGKVCGLKCKRFSAKKWIFWFQNSSYGEEFLRINTPSSQVT